jgi:hypothetical protein
MVVDAKKFSTSGEPKSSSENRKASTDYTKATNGHKTPDQQGASNELGCGPSKDEGNSTGKTLEENEELDIPDESLEEILRELEQEVSQEDCGAETIGADSPEGESPVAQVHEDDDEEIDIDSLLEADDEIASADEAEEDEDDIRQENNSLKKEIEESRKKITEYNKTVSYLQDRINEVNLLNSKLLYTNKLFKQASLTNEQKLKVIESFDLTKSVREVKIVYATLAESFNFGGKKTVTESVKKPVSTTVKTITEGLASKVVASTKPTKASVLTEGAEMANRFKKLAGIK